MTTQYEKLENRITCLEQGHNWSFQLIRYGSYDGPWWDLEAKCLRCGKEKDKAISNRVANYLLRKIND